LVDYFEKRRAEKAIFPSSPMRAKMRGDNLFSGRGVDSLSLRPAMPFANISKFRKIFF